MSDVGDQPHAPELRAGEIIGGKYLLREPIGVGGMGSLWKARNLATGADVAAKFLLARHAAAPEAILRFRREARATASLTHRGIVRVFDLIEIDPERGSLVMILELLRGRSLAERIREMGPLSMAETVDIALDLLSALSHAHGFGIVHRDLKPDNIFLAIDPDGRQIPRIIDFGVSKMLRDSPITLDGVTVGTVSYMSPEQTMGSSVDPRADLFSVGVILYECLAGVNPYESELQGQLPYNLLSVFRVAPRRPSGVTDALWSVLCCAMSYRAADRFDNAVDFANALRAATPGARAPSSPSPPSDEELPVRLPVQGSSTNLRGSKSDPAANRGRLAAPLALVVAAVAAVVWGSSALASVESRTTSTAEQAAAGHHKRLVALPDVVGVDVPGDEPMAPAEAAPSVKEATPSRVRRQVVAIIRTPGF